MELIYIESQSQGVMFDMGNTNIMFVNKLVFVDKDVFSKIRGNFPIGEWYITSKVKWE